MAKKRNLESMHRTNYDRNKILKYENDNLVIYCLNNNYFKSTKIEGITRFQSCASPKKWLSKIVILIHFMHMHIYQESHVLGHQDHALCGKGRRNWYTVQPYTVHISVADFCYLCQAIHEVGTTR